MRALVSTAPGGPGTLAVGELPEPAAGPGEIVVAVEAAGVNYPDALVIEDRYQVRPQRPFAPGGEIAGAVAAIGAGVTDFAVGDRVMAVITTGGMAERVAVAAEAAFRVPDEKPIEEAAALLLTYGTAIYALIERGGLRAGETLLVLGAAGGIGIAATEVGKALGARVVAGVSNADKLAAAREAGADGTLVYPAGPLDRAAARSLADAFKTACGRTADVILDPVGGDYAEPALRAIAWEGRYLVVGFPAGIPKLPLNLPLLKSCDVRGVAYGAAWRRDLAMNRRLIERLVGWWCEGRIRPRVAAVLPLERGGEAIATLAARAAIGKLIVRVAP